MGKHQWATVDAEVEVLLLESLELTGVLLRPAESEQLHVLCPSLSSACLVSAFQFYSTSPPPTLQPLIVFQHPFVVCDIQQVKFLFVIGCFMFHPDMTCVVD